MCDRIILHITPQPYVKVLPGEKKLFYIPERCQYIPSLQRHRRKKKGEEDEEWNYLWENDIRLCGCELWNNTGFCKHTATRTTRRRKKRIIKYNDYKKEIKRLCDEVGLTLQVCGWSMYFYFPIPDYWSKKKKMIMRGQMKISKPDRDNCEKAIHDALGKRRGDGSNLLPDEVAAQSSGIGKFWMYDTEAKEGYIEILLNQPLYNPFNVMFIKQI